MVVCRVQTMPIELRHGLSAAARHILRYLAATMVLCFVGAAPAYADVIVVENAEQLEFIKRVINSSQKSYLEASDAMAPCYQDRHAQCAKDMRAAISKNLPSAILNASTGITEYLQPIRNNQFRYERAFSLLFLNALVQRRGASCADFTREAAFTSSSGKTFTLADHLAAAKAEIGNRTYLPEYQMLLRVTTVLSPCVARA